MLKFRIRDEDLPLAHIDCGLAIAEFGNDEVLRTANKTFHSLFKYNATYVKGSHHSFLDLKKRPCSNLKPKSINHLDKGIVYSDEYFGMYKSSREIWLHFDYVLVLRRTQHVKMVINFKTDIAALKGELLDLKGLLTALHRSQAAIAFDSTGQIMGANTNFLAVMDYDLEELEGRHRSLLMDCAASRTRRPAPTICPKTSRAGPCRRMPAKPQMPNPRRALQDCRARPSIAAPKSPSLP